MIAAARFSMRHWSWYWSRMAGERGGLRLPGRVTFTTLTIALALAGASCGDDDGPSDASPRRDTGAAEDGGMLADSGPTDSGSTKEYFCVYDESMDAGMPFDANVCMTIVSNPDDCPPGCSTAVI